MMKGFLSSTTKVVVVFLAMTLLSVAGEAASSPHGSSETAKAARHQEIVIPHPELQPKPLSPEQAAAARAASAKAAERDHVELMRRRAAEQKQQAEIARVKA